MGLGIGGTPRVRVCERGDRYPAVCGPQRPPGRATRVLLGIVAVDVDEVTGLGVVSLDGGGIEVLGGVLQGQTQVGQLDLHFVDRLLSEVTDVEEIRLGALGELTDGVDLLTLQAVVGANGEVQVLDGHAVVGVGLGLLGGGAEIDALSVGVQLAGEAEQLNQGLACRRESVTGGDGVLRLDIDDQLVEVRALRDTGGLDLVAHLEHRGVDLVHGDAADLSGVTGQGGGNVSTSPLHDQFDVDLALLIQGGDVEVRVVDLDTRRRLDVGCGDLAGALLAEVHDDGVDRIRGQHESLDVQDDVADILLHTRDRGELVEDALDLHAGHRCARDGRQQGTTQRVTEGVTEAGLQRLDGEPGAGGVDVLLVELRTL